MKYLQQFHKLFEFLKRTHKMTAGFLVKFAVMVYNFTVLSTVKSRAVDRSTIQF